MNPISEVKKAAEILNSGGIIIFPTETVQGIGCLLAKTESINKLYKIKQRDRDKPTLVLVKDLAQAEEFVSFNKQALALVQRFWPGALTICLPAQKNVPKDILGPGNTLGVRVSSHPFIQQLQKYLSAPLLAPSANFQDQKSPSSVSQIDKRLSSLVDYVVPIDSEAEQPSTIVSFNKGKYNVVREGDIARSEINKVLKFKE